MPWERRRANARNLSKPFTMAIQTLSARLINIGYYMLRAWYRFYSPVFNTISRTSESTSEWRCTRDFSSASSELQVIARSCDWFIALFVPVVIGRSDCFGFGFPTVIWKPIYQGNWSHGHARMFRAFLTTCTALISNTRPFSLLYA